MYINVTVEHGLRPLGALSVNISTFSGNRRLWKRLSDYAFESCLDGGAVLSVRSFEWDTKALLIVASNISLEVAEMRSFC